ncbi:GntR family transcriptional regulator [Streptomyces lincolnensis]|uniref:GntR family transcriptional regulator n=1 Tax=Streptomyces lincolnensis TaxID=1915 RepID=UPI0035AB881B
MAPACQNLWELPSSGAVCAGSNPARTVPASGPSGIGGEFGVSRDTVQRVIRELRDEGWIETRQGSGSHVVRTQVVHWPKSGERRAAGPSRWGRSSAGPSSRTK